ncbi:uncharacterized protein LOC114527200 [Dendronephthya gigantea]|uniref:uncharacterized protein LOC114527200 n=1 Tax=Dendronephthya gigantea TaxID=151771 RepID=UPI00106BDFF8|nr:uncharacterized protein LOC114527200 [Dendronephthya gigantea]
MISIIIWKIHDEGEKNNGNSELLLNAFGNERISHEDKRSKPKKYISYQPPGGGWNNQRIAFENAVIMAAMLKRTLLVHPLAPHDYILELKTRFNQSAGYTIYNMLRTEELIPISKLIDLNRLSSLLPLQEITSSHNEFKKKFRNSSWYKVCHNGLAYAWVDKIPPGFDTSSLKLEKYSKYFRKAQKIAKYRQVCSEKSEIELLGIWEFLRELRKRKEDIIYFDKGSLFVRHILFTDYKRALDAQRALIDYIHPTFEVLHNAEQITSLIGKPFNAIHVRRNDHKTGRRLDIHYWISRLAKANALKYSNKLYIATDETDFTWFSALKEAGYKIFFAKDFDVFREINQANPVKGKDIVGFHEQVICSYAKIFVKSYYSTFSRVIERYREVEHWDKNRFRNLVFSPVKWLNIYRP